MWHFFSKLLCHHQNYHITINICGLTWTKNHLKQIHQDGVFEKNVKRAFNRAHKICKPRTIGLKKKKLKKWNCHLYFWSTCSVRSICSLWIYIKLIYILTPKHFLTFYTFLVYFATFLYFGQSIFWHFCASTKPKFSDIFIHFYLNLILWVESYILGEIMPFWDTQSKQRI